MTAEISLEAQLKYLESLLMKRERMLADWVKAGKTTRERADADLEMLRAVLATLQEIAGQ